jgi:hypothetical protein
MLAWLIHVYVSNNALTPTYILVLFIVSVLGAGWTIYTLFSYHRSRTNAHFIAFIDLCFLGSLIGAVYQLRFISHQSCSAASSSAFWAISFPPNSVSPEHTCNLLKASYAFGIMNCVLFVITAFFAFVMGRPKKDEKVVVREESHHSRHGHRRAASHRSHHSHRSDHSRRSSSYV